MSYKQHAHHEHRRYASLHYSNPTPECYVHQDKLTREAFGHLTEVRHLLRQTNDRRVFTIIRSSSDSLLIINWRGNSSHFNVDSLKPTGKRISSYGSPLKEAHQPPKIKLPNRPSTYRSVKVYEISTMVQNKINTGLSLDLSNFFPNSNYRLDYAEKITGNVNTPIQTSPSKKKDDSENPPPATSTPNTRNGGVRQGIFDKHHHFRRFRS